MKPRERTGQVSIARAAPAGHSAPMPMPSSARKRNSRKKLGAKPARKLQTEYQAIEIISGVLRPIRSASQPLAVAPISRIHRVIVNTAATSGTGTSNSLAIGAMINKNAVKSKASRVHPAQAATKAYHWSLVGSFHQGMEVTVVAVAAGVAIAHLACSERPVDEPCCQPTPVIKTSHSVLSFRLMIQITNQPSSPPGEAKRA